VSSCSCWVLIGDGGSVRAIASDLAGPPCQDVLVFFFKQKTAYEIGLGIPAEPLFRSIAEGQWYRYAPSYVSPAYHLLEGFPFIQEPPSGDLLERVLIRHHDYDQCFQSFQLLQWNSQVKFNVTVYRNLPTTRDSIMTS